MTSQIITPITSLTIEDVLKYVKKLIIDSKSELTTVVVHEDEVDVQESDTEPKRLLIGSRASFNMKLFSKKKFPLKLDRVGSLYEDREGRNISLITSILILINTENSKDYSTFTVEDKHIYFVRFIDRMRKTVHKENYKHYNITAKQLKEKIMNLVIDDHVIGFITDFLLIKLLVFDYNERGITFYNNQSDDDSKLSNIVMLFKYGKDYELLVSEQTNLFSYDQLEHLIKKANHISIAKETEQAEISSDDE